MLARAVAHVSASALQHNLHALSRRAGVPLLLPVKADAYGHGLEVVSRVAAAHPDVWGLAVATPQEAVNLAALNLGKPVLLLTPSAPEEVGPLADLGVRLPVSTLQDAQQLPAHARAHLKVDTGMNRLGARPAEAVSIGQYLAGRGLLEGAYTHFASADEPDLAFARQQLELFQGVLEHLPPLLAHAASGGGLVSFGPLPGMALARPGLASYGFLPAHLRPLVPLKPVMTLRARVNFIHDVYAGESVSYNNLWTAPHDVRVAVLGMGYADGYPRNATLKASVLIGGRSGQPQRRPVLGRICMDQMMVDISGLDVQVGDWAELWGAGEITVSDVAAWGDTIEYEVLTGLGQRVERQVAP
ncbi:alanine racemase [Deinococcus cavernae]|uniref:Alanine racemase n=1 Tax=Deinococcus cavernae TaxID=2320857 RepID=A0A418VBP4_9DEIO|nr:alanine racemase [Deinococcus cavernae]RJF73571.1 alanine racemase [Deinococcus cavernae]